VSKTQKTESSNLTRTSADCAGYHIDLGEGEDLLRTYTRTFMGWAQFSEALDRTFSMSSALIRTHALLDVAGAEFEGALSMSCHTVTRTREFEFRPNRLPDELMTRVATVP
jgi:hypothetical protein